MKQARYPEEATSRPHEVNAPTVSVIIPTYNRAHMIGRALHSVLSQEFTDFEVIVVDDASTDDTEAVVRAIGDPRIRYIRERRNGGPNAARNRGMRAARGEFLAFLDSDDEWLPGKLEKQLARFAELPDSVGAVYTGVETIDDDGTVSHFVPEHRGRIHSSLLARNVLHGASQSIMIRRSVAQEAGEFDVRYPAIGDYDYWLRVSACCEIEAVPDVLARYHNVGSSNRVSRSIRNNLLGREIFFQKHRADMERAGVAHLFLEESARRRLKAAFWEPKEARKLLRAALQANPGSRSARALLARSYIPRSVFQIWAKGRKVFARR
jgi:glycosyltransferase involved in cell wall biosynthesis